jgi:hypothetical protein
MGLLAAIPDPSPPNLTPPCAAVFLLLLLLLLVVVVVHLTVRPFILSGRAPAPPRRDRCVLLPPRLDTLLGLPMLLGEAPRLERGEAEKTEMEWLEMCDAAGEEG